MPLASVVVRAMPSMNAMIPSVIVMPIDLMISSGLAADPVVHRGDGDEALLQTMLTIAAMTVILNESDSLKPTASQRTLSSRRSR